MGDGAPVSTAEAAEDIWAGGGSDDRRERDRDWDDIREDRQDRIDDIRGRVDDRMDELGDRLEERLGDRFGIGDGDRDRDRDERDQDQPEPTPEPVVEQPEGRPGYVWVDDHWERERAPVAADGPVVRDHRDEVALFDTDEKPLEPVIVADLLVDQPSGGVADALSDVAGVDLGGSVTDTADVVGVGIGEDLVSNIDDIATGVEDALESVEDKIGDLFGG
jgi:hypothetical protein